MIQLIIFNVCISFFCLIPVYYTYYQKPQNIKNYFKKHILIFFIKLLFISMFIYLFINNFNGLNIQLFIITGYINFTIFHFIEGFISQKNI
ncbi:MAG: hypothetical protein CMG64_00985 [Candidatus Marinimicrobia bacterium]|nr:hypothetical protein [Candidatus Neomarinimicrobiota bacterium]